MKQTILLKARWLLCGLLAVFLTTNVWADEGVYKTALFGSSYNSKSVSNYTDTWTATNGDFTVSLSNFNNNNNGWNYVKCGRKNYASVGTIITDAAIDKAVTKVVVTIDAITATKVNSIKLYRSTNKTDWTEESSFTAATGAQEVAIVSANQAANLYYKVKFDCASASSNGLVSVSKVEYYAEVGGGGDEPAVTLSSIAVSGELSDKTYENTDRIDLTGLVVTGTYSNASTNNVTADATWEVRTDGTSESFTPSTYELTAGQTSVQVRATVDDKKSDWVIINYLTVTAHVATPGEHTINLNNAFYGVAAGNNPEEQSATQNDITVVSGCASNASSKTYYDSGHIRYYANSYLELSVPDGYTMTSIEFTADGKWDGSITASVGTYDNNSKTWTGNSQNVNFSFGAQNRIASATITYAAIVPTVTVDPASLTFAAKQNIAVEGKTFTLTGANLESGLTLAASEGFTVSPTSLTAEAAMADGGVEVTVTPATPTTTTTPVEGTVTISGGGLASNVIVNLSMAVTPTYAVAVAVNDNTMGSATINGGTATVYAEYADEVTLVATANTGYEFVNWTVSDDDIDLGEDAAKANGAVAVIGAAGTITANFQAQSCSVLDAPVLDGTIATTYNSATINWAAVANADGYNVEVKLGDVVTGSDVILEAPLSFTVNNLEANTTYSYTIQTVGDGTTYCEESGVLAGSFTTADYPSVDVTYSENGTTFSGGNKQIMTAFALPTEVSNTCSKQFVGWTTADYSDATNAPAEFYAPGAAYTITENAAVTLYAVYATVSSGGTSTTNITYSGSTGSLADGENSAATFNLNADDWSIVATKNSANAVGVNQEGAIRLYYNANGSNTLTITAPQTISSVALTFTGDSYNNAWVKVAGETVTLTDGVYPINNTTFVIGNANTSNAQVRISNIAVNFATAGTASDYATTCTEQVEAPVFGLAAGTYYEGKAVTLTCATEDATIYYTTDGTTPTSASTEYTTAIDLSARAITTIKAIAVKTGMDNSEVAEAEYNINLPYTFTEFAALEKENNKEYAVMGIVSSKNATLNSGTLTYAISANGSTDNEIRCYKGLKLNKATFESADDINLGDNVTVVGTWSTQYSNLNANNWMLAYTAKVLSSVTVGGTAVKTEYSANETFDFDGLTATAHYSNTGYSALIDNAEITWATNLSENKVTESTTVQVTATYGGISSATYNVAVTVSTKDLSSIALGQNAYTVYKGAALPKPAVTATYTEGEPADVSAEAVYDTESAYDAATADVYTITVSYTFGTTTKTAQYTVTVQEYANADDAPYTVAQALDIIVNAIGNVESADEIVVSGTVSEDNINNNKNRYKISDGTNELLVYGGKGFNKASFTATNYPQEGDVVVVKGNVINYNGNTPEFATGKSYLLSQIRPVMLSVDNVTAFEVGTADMEEGDLTIDRGGSTGEITFASEDETVVTIVEGKLHAVAPGTVTVTANMAATANENALNYAATSTTFQVKVIAAQTRYAVTFAANGGEGDAPVMEDQLEGATFNLPANTYTYAGHKFAGWSDGITTYAADDEYIMPATAVEFTAQWTEIPYYAGVYTSNVSFGWTGGSGESNSKVVINSTEYDAQKVGSSSKTGSVIVTVPYGTHTLHFHAAAWNSASSMTIAASGVNNMSLSSFALTADGGFSGNTTYNLQNDPTDQYYVMTFDATTDVETTITFSKASGDDNRFMLYGINQEGGVERELDHIEISSNAEVTNYEDGDIFNPQGLIVTAVYNVGASEDVTNDVTWSFNPAILTEGTTSVTATATYGDKNAQTIVAVSVTASTHVYTTREVVFVVKSGDAYYAMGQDNTGSYLNGVGIEMFNGKMLNVAVADRAAITWILREYPDGKTAIMTQNGKFLNGANSGTNLTLSDEEILWTWDATYGCYQLASGTQSARTFLYQAGTVNKFRFYNKTNIDATGYSSAPILATEYVDGTVETLREGLEAGKLGTLCWNKELVEVEGAVLYDPEYPAVGQGGVGFIETTSMEAGKPFVFQASGEKIRALVTGEATLTPGTNNGLVGVFTGTPVDGDYIVYQNRIHRAYNSTVAANRAYLVMGDIVDQRGVNGNAPARRRLVIGQPSQTPTGDEQVKAELKAEKVMIDGRIYILRGEKMYDLNGQQVR